MIYDSKSMEEKAAVEIASLMCAAARTAPKAKGRDILKTVVLTGTEKDELADMMEKVSDEYPGNDLDFFYRDADNIRSANAVMLLGVKKAFAGLRYCGYCGFSDCAECGKNGATCVFSAIDLGIALGSAAAVAADNRADSRILYSAGTAVRNMPYGEGADMWHAIPISITSKNPFFDRKRKDK